MKLVNNAGIAKLASHIRTVTQVGPLMASEGWRSSVKTLARFMIVIFVKA